MWLVIAKPKVVMMNTETATNQYLQKLTELYKAGNATEHSYRPALQEFLKTDFPRVPLPVKETFWQYVALGSQLRQWHLLDHPDLGSTPVTYPINGDNTVDKPTRKDGRVYINQSQCFDNVSRTAWEFWIGGYQPAQKCLKDRKGRQLNFDDIRHYQKMIHALDSTNALMQQIDAVYKDTN